MPTGKVWRDLDHLDLNFTDHSGKVGLAARFYVGATASDPSTFAVLDANGKVAGQGLPGATGTIQTSTFVLDLANSNFQGSGPTGPTVTINFAVIFKPEAAGNGVAEEAAHVYNLDISGTDRITDAVQSQPVGTWAVRQTY